MIGSRKLGLVTMYVTDTFELFALISMELINVDLS